MRKFTKSLFVFSLLPILACGAAPKAAPQAPAAAPVTYRFDGDAAWADLVKQVAWGPRVPGTPAQIACRDWMVSRLKESCDDVQVQSSTAHWNYYNKDIPIYNVIGTQNWADAKVRMVLLAHWDSRPFSDGPSSPKADYEKPIPGADDGASGVAVMLELAKAIKDRHPGLGIMYLFDDGEDTGPDMNQMLLGVRYFVDHLPTPPPDYGILLDMIGQRDLQVPMEQESLQRAPAVEKAFYMNAASAGFSDIFPYRLGDDIEDDHLPFLDKGIPTIDLIDFSGYQQYWHTQNDTPAHCSENSLLRVGQALESFLTLQPPFNPKTSG